MTPSPFKPLPAASRLPVLVAALSLVAATMPARAGLYPIDSHGSYAVDLVRHFNEAGLTSTAAVANNVLIAGNSLASLSINGGGQKTQWQVAAANRAASSSSLQITLDQVYSVNQIVARNRFLVPDTFDLRVSDTGFGSMTTIASGVTAMVGDNPFYFSTLPVKYVELTWHGANAFGGGPDSFTDIQRISVFPAATSTEPHIKSGFNIRGAITPVFTNDSAAAGGGGWLDAISRVWDGDIDGSYLRGNGSGLDARFVADLGSILPVHNVTLGFYDDQNWANGAKVELSADGVNYTTIFNSSGGSTTNITLAGSIGARFIRVTNKGSAGGALTEIEVQLIPEPASAALLALGVTTLLVTRRRRHVDSKPLAPAG